MAPATLSLRAWPAASACDPEAFLPGRKSIPCLPDVDRRDAPRTPVSVGLHLFPLSDDGERELGPSQVVECCDISKSGLRLRHAAPLTFRTVGLSIPFGGDPNLLWVTRLQWCRFTRSGLYESGGLILRTAERSLFVDSA